MIPFEVVSMFFLTVYGIVNFVAAIETLAGGGFRLPTSSTTETGPAT